MGRPLARAPAASPEPSHNAPRDPLPRRQPSVSYMENGMRWMEKQEVKSIRQAMEDMDLVEEKKIHSAAQEEAAELVWKHQNPEVASGPFANPDLKTRDYRSHLRQGSYHRTHSQGSHHRTQSHHAVSSDSQRSTSGSSQGSDKLTFSQRIVQVPRKVSPPTNKVSVQKRRSPSGKSYDQLAEAVDADIKVAHRRISSGSGKRIISGEKKKFMSPDDRIWEDPDEEKSPPKKKEPVIEEEKPQTRPAASQALPSYVRKNPFARVRVQYEKNLERSNSAPQLQTLPGATLPRHDRIEIQRNPPSQSRNPLYTSNDLVLPPTPPVETGVEADEVAPKTTPSKDGKELRGDDIRAATSKSRTAYSPNLPRPTMVSEKPGRPIVSFQKDYKPKEMVMQEQHSAPSFKDRPLPDPLQIGSPSGSPHRLPCEPRGNIPGSSPASRIPKINLEDVPKWAPSQSTPTSARGPPPPIPTILAPDDPPIPSIALPEEPTLGSATPADPIPSINADTPSINVSDSSSPSSSPTKSRIPQRPLPAPSPGLPLPRHASTTPASPSKSTPHYTPSVRQSGTLCAHCALPIAGRILSAAGERLHPGCFTCHECNTNLELVAFYPEPEQQRAARIERIRARQSGHQVTIPEGITEEAFHHLEHTDGDGTLRFYCHLDFHELFSPRCKSCKTPIEGEVIVACGAEWHVGHFFCAQCGDPFDSSMPFVEKDGYAWCVNCHTNRYSSKCRKCRKPVTDVVVKALGSDWHSECFRCLVSYVSSLNLEESVLTMYLRSVMGSSRTGGISFGGTRRIQCV